MSSLVVVRQGQMRIPAFADVTSDAGISQMQHFPPCCL